MSYLPSGPNFGIQRPTVDQRAPSRANPPISASWKAVQTPAPSQFLEYWNALRTNFLKIALIAAIGAGLGWLVGTLRPTMYQARTVLDIRSLNENVLNPQQGTPTTGSVLPESYIQTEIKILSSDSLRKKAMTRLEHLAPDIKPVPSEDISWWRSVTKKFDATSIPFKTLAADAAQRVKVRGVGNTRIVELLCDARDGQLAANMCNNLAETYIQYNLESRLHSTKETGDWLQSQLDDVRRRLTKAENDLKDSSQAGAFLFDSDSGENLAQDKLRQLQTELSRAQADRIHKESDYIVARSGAVDSIPLALDSGAVREYRMKLSELRRQLAEASSTMTPEHYRVRELTLQIAEVDKSLTQEREGILSRLRGDFETAKRQESVFGAAYEKQAKQVSQHADSAVTLNMRKREVDSDRKLYETLLQRVDEVGLSAALRTSTISVVDPAVAAADPYSPNLLASVGVGFLGGSVLGLALSLVRLRSDRTIHEPGEASAHLQLRELGVVPAIGKRRIRAVVGNVPAPAPVTGLAIEKHEPTNAEAMGVAVRNFPSSMALATWLRIPEMTESFFGIMSSLRFVTERGEPACVIVVTSPDPAEGKTTVTTNLAIALAQIGRKVILVDGDLRRPGLGRVFNIASQQGLAELLESDEPIDEASLDKFLCKTPVPNLMVLTTRAVREGIGTKLHSSRMKLLLDRLRREFDNVIIDSPPMLRIPDARVLGWLSDGVILVLRARKTTKDSALAAYDRLLQDGTQVLGTVLNDWNPRQSDNNAYKPYLIGQ